MKRGFLLLTIGFLLFLSGFAQIPAGYYNTAAGLSGDILRDTLRAIITRGYTKLSYTPGVWNAYAYTDVTIPGGTIIFDMYSRRCDGTANYFFTLSTNQCTGGSSVEGQCYSREHCLPNSIWGGFDNAANPQYSDLHHLFPCDQYVNQYKSNHMISETSAPTYISTNGSMVGPCSYPGYSGTVFEPLDCYKGDFARAWLYLATRYMSTMPSWTPSAGSAAMWPLLYNSTTNNYQPWVINLFLSWCTQDPVDQWEINRNDAIYYQSGQHNRNPYVDHPEYICLVWGTSCVSAPIITNIVTNPLTPTSTDIVNVSASITDDGSITSAVLYWGTSPTTLSNSITMTVGTPPTYTTTSGIPAQVVGTTIYYKIVATDNQANSTTSDIYSYNIPQGEPSNQVTGFTCGTTTSISIPLSWTDATGAIIPTAYLIKMSSVSLADIIDPVDGVPVSDGTNAINVLAGIQTTTFTGLSSSATYYFKIYAYSNTGTNVNYNLISVPSTNCTTLAAGGCASTVFNDDFNRAAVSPGGTPSMTYVNTLVGTATATTNSSTNLRITTGTTSGVSYVTGTTSTFSTPYNSVLSSNSGLVTWTFNFRWNRASSNNPAAPSSGAYGQVIILAGSSSTLTTGTGYAVVYGNSGAPDPIRLCAYSNGIGTLTDICSSGVSDILATNNYASVRVTYNPSGNLWSLYVRDDGTSSWSDPYTGVITQKGSTTANSAYTGSALNTFGFLWSHATTTTNTGDYDNFNVAVNVSAPTSYDVTGGGSYCSGGSGMVVGLSNSETGVNYQLLVDDVNTGSPIAGTGAAINFSNQTVEGTYTVLATKVGLNCNTVMNGAVTIMINPILTASVSIAANPGTSVCPSTSVTFTATITNGGTSPTYQWKKNGSNIIGETNPTYSDIPVNNDYYTCVITSDLACVTGSPATSNTLTMVVAGVAASVNIVASPSGAICSGTNVTFTATPTNGGTPTYQWKKNGSNIVGETNSTYSSTSLINGDIITCQMTSSLSCATGSPAISNSITMTVNAVLPVSVSISASTGTTICAGTSVTFTATLINGGAIPAYQWKKGGINISGETNATYVTATIVNGDAITCVLTSNATCVSGNPATSNVINMVVNPVLSASVNITAVPAGSICSGTSVTFTATPTNGGSTPTYQWKKNGIVVGTGSTYTDATLNNSDQIFCIMTSNASPCLTGSPATSNTITMTVGPPLTASVSISASTGTNICSGTSVVFAATATNGGTPTYQWKKNGSNIVGETNSTYTTSTLVNGDFITCQMTSSLTCVTGSPAISNTLTMTVNPILPVSVSITASTGTTICAGTSVTFTATPTNGGALPAYQWKKNGSNIVGETNATYITSTLANGDAISCVLTSNATCISGNPATSNIITMAVNPFPDVAGLISGTATVCQSQYNVSYSVSAITNATSYTWSYTGTGAAISGATNSITIDFSASATSGILTVKGTNSCGSGTTSANYAITVNPLPDAAGVISGTATVCQGQSGVAYSVVAIVNANFYTWNYTGAGATINGTTNNVTIDFTTNATSGILTVKGLNPCGYGTVSANYAITVNPLPVAPTSVSATLTTICSGFSTSLTYIGGSGTTFGWYTSSCGGSSIGTGNNLSVSPTLTTTYYGRWENGCGNSTCQTVTITVTPNNTITLTSAPGSTNQTVCVGTPIITVTYSTIGATGATITGLPSGVTGSWAANVVTISGTPTVSGGPLTYTITLTGGCP